MPKAIEYDSKRGEKAYLEVQPLLAALKPEQVARVYVKLANAAVQAIGLGRRGHETALRRRFASLPNEEFYIAHIDRLENLGWAVLHVLKEATQAAVACGRRGEEREAPHD